MNSEWPFTRPDGMREEMYWDDNFHAWRNIIDGHRVYNADGTELKSTRRLALRNPFVIIDELKGRRNAKKRQLPHY